MPTEDDREAFEKATNSSINQREQHRQRLERFYIKYDQSKLDKLDVILDKYQGGSFNELFSLLQRKYGKEPSKNEDLSKYLRNGSARSSAVPQVHHQSSASASAAVANTANNDSLNLPFSDFSDYSNNYNRLVTFYGHYAPSKVNEIEKILALFQGKEKAMWSILLQKYGPYPSDEKSEKSDATSPPAPPSKKDYRAKIVAIFERYDPKQLDKVDPMLKKYAGKEEALLVALEVKYEAQDGKNDAKSNDKTEEQEHDDNTDDVELSEATFKKIKYMFDMFDLDGSKYLEGSEAMAAMISLFPGSSPTQCLEYIMLADKNNDKKLSFEEFTSIAKDVLVADC